MDLRSSKININRSHPILSGKVIEVYPSLGRVDVEIDYPDSRKFLKCEYTSPYTGNNNGGIDFVPTRNSYCLVLLNSSEGGAGIEASPLVIGFRPRTPASLTSRVDLKPGDIRIKGEYNNDILLRNNGDIFIVSNELNMLAFISSEDLVRFRTKNLKHELAGGDLTWVASSDQAGGPVAYLKNIRRFVSDEHPYLTIKAGSSAGGGISVVMHQLGATVDESAEPLFINLVPKSAGFMFNVGDQGEVAIASRSSVEVEALGPISATSQVSANITAPNTTIGSSTSSISQASNLPTRIYAPNGLIIEAPFIKIQGQGQTFLNADSTDDSKSLITVELLEWLFNHTHSVLSVPSETLPPLGSPDGYGIAIAAKLQELTALAGGGDPIAQAQLASLTQSLNDNNNVINSINDITTKDTKAK